MEKYLMLQIIHISPNHPQTNGVVEVTHKEIKKYICNEYLVLRREFLKKLKI